MNRADRLTTILDILADQGQIDIAEIVDRLDVSAATARRDLDILAEQRLLTRTHGGATGQSVSYDLPLRYRRSVNASAKDAIALAASALVHPGDVVGLCGGTTSTAIAVALSSRADLQAPEGEVSLTFVTNALNIASQLAVRAQFKVVVTGGVVHPRSYELVGPFSDAVLSQVSPTIAFLGVGGIDLAVGASMGDENEAAISAAMARRAHRTVVVADSAKIGRRTFATAVAPEGIDTLITDDGIDPADAARFRDAGITVIIAPTS